MTWFVRRVEVFSDDMVLATISDGTIEIEVLARVTALDRDEAAFVECHVLGPGKNQVGPRLRSIAQHLKEFLDVRRLRIEGATRTSGANPGRKPAPRTF